MVSVEVIFYYYFFFFSSRRRHTRCLSDWSSDVCSSDLSATMAIAVEMARKETADEMGKVLRYPRAVRSEERRVGKECRCWWSAYHLNKKSYRQRQVSQTAECMQANGSEKKSGHSIRQ